MKKIMIKFLRKVKFKFQAALSALFARPSLSRVPFEIERIGTEYGGWWFAKTKTLKGSKVVFCGAGEDISFDIGFASLYSARVYIVDPTPRAIDHVKSVLSRSGSGSESGFALGGKQDPSSYDLSGIRGDQISLVEYALWNKNSILRFYSPSNPEHVSHSIVNYQNSYSNDSDYIEVEARTILDLVECGILPSSVEILKLDIEGAEHEVIENMLASNFRPRQILVEYDELSTGGLRGIYRFRRTHKKLNSFGYKLFNREGLNYSYLLLNP